MAETNYSRGRNSANLEYSQEMDENTMIIIGVIAALIVIILLIYFLGYVPRTERYFLRVWKQFLRRNESSTGDSREHITKVVGEATSCELRSNPCYILKYFGYLESDFKVHSGPYYKYDQVKFDLLVTKNKKQQHKSLDLLIPAYFYDKVSVAFSNTKYSKSDESKIKKAFENYVKNYEIIFYSPTRTLITRDEGIFSKEERQYGVEIGEGLPVHVPFNSLTALDKIALYENDFKIEEEDNCDFYKKKVEKPKPIPKVSEKCSSKSWGLGTQEVKSSVGCNVDFEISDDACDSLTPEQLADPFILLSCPSIVKKDSDLNDTESFTDYVETFQETPPEEYDASSGIQLGKFQVTAEDPDSECDYYLPGIVRCIKIDSNNNMLVEFKTHQEAPELAHGGFNSNLNSSPTQRKGLQNINVYILKKENFELTFIKKLDLDDGVDYRGKFSGLIPLGQVVNKLDYSYLVEIEHIFVSNTPNTVPVFKCYRYVWSSNDNVKYTPYLQENNVSQKIYDMDNDKLESLKNYQDGIIRNILYYNNNNADFKSESQEQLEEQGHFKIWFKEESEYPVLNNINGFNILEVFIEKSDKSNRIMVKTFMRGDKDLRGYYYKIKNDNTPEEYDTDEDKANKNRFYSAINSGKDIVFKISYVKNNENTNTYTYKWKNNKTLQCGLSIGDKCLNENSNLQTHEYLSNKERRENAEKLWEEMSKIFQDKTEKVRNVISLMDKSIKNKFKTAKNFFMFIDNAVNQINNMLTSELKISKEILISKGLYLNFGDKVKLSNVNDCSSNKLNRYTFFRTVMTWSNNSDSIVLKTIKDCGLEGSNIDNYVIYKKLVELYKEYYKRVNKKIPMDNSETQTSISNFLVEDNLCGKDPRTCSGHYGKDGSNDVLKDPNKKWNCDSCNCRDLDNMCIEEEDNYNNEDLIGNFVNANCKEFLLKDYEVEECGREYDQGSISYRYFTDIIEKAITFSYDFQKIKIDGKNICISQEKREVILGHLIVLVVNIMDIILTIIKQKFKLKLEIIRGKFTRLDGSVVAQYPLYLRIPKPLYIETNTSREEFEKGNYEYVDIPFIDFNNPHNLYFDIRKPCPGFNVKVGNEKYRDLELKEPFRFSKELAGVYNSMRVKITNTSEDLADEITNNPTSFVEMEKYIYENGRGMEENFQRDINLDEFVKKTGLQKRGGKIRRGTTINTYKVPYAFYSVHWISHILTKRDFIPDMSQDVCYNLSKDKRRSNRLIMDES